MSTSDLQQLGTALRRERLRGGMTVRQAATASGMTASTVSRLETGHIDGPRPEHLQALARAYGADIEDLYALAGYLMPERLPELRPYLRAKYGLPEQATDQLDEYFQALRDRWGAQQSTEGTHDGGDDDT